MRPHQRKEKKATKKTPAKKTTTRREREAPAPARVARVERAIIAAPVKTTRREAPARAARSSSSAVVWTPGKLPRDTYIKTNSATGEFVVISREEWEKLGR
jgi:hypothetical protein